MPRCCGYGMVPNIYTATISINRSTPQHMDCGVNSSKIAHFLRCKYFLYIFTNLKFFFSFCYCFVPPLLFHICDSTSSRFFSLTPESFVQLLTVLDSISEIGSVWLDPSLLHLLNWELDDYVNHCEQS